MFFEHFEKHLSEAKDGVGGKSLGIGEMTDGIKCSEEIRGAIDQKEFGSIRHIPYSIEQSASSIASKLFLLSALRYAPCGLPRTGSRDIGMDPIPARMLGDVHRIIGGFDEALQIEVVPVPG
jgi:hypothetical protein